MSRGAKELPDHAACACHSRCITCTLILCSTEQSLQKRFQKERA